LRSAEGLTGSVPTSTTLRSVAAIAPALDRWSPASIKGPSSDGIVIVDDQALIAEALGVALESHGLVVLGIARSAAETLRLAARYRPGLILINLGLSNLDGLQLGERIRTEFPSTKLVAVASSDNPDSATEASMAGFDGCVLRDTPLRHFISTIRTSFAADLTESTGTGGRQGSGDRHAALLAKQLTRRELQVLSLLAEGRCGDDIGRALSISPNTVRTHIGNVLSKLQVHSRLEAVTFAVRHRLVQGPSGSHRRHLEARPRAELA
jgi:DNA-binding NarL/FixJ family response regulator